MAIASVFVTAVVASAGAVGVAAGVAVASIGSNRHYGKCSNHYRNCYHLCGSHRNRSLRFEQQ